IQLQKRNFDIILTAPGGECTSCGSCSSKVDCYPEPGSSESGCYSRGCLWCPSNNPGDPWCIIPDGGKTTIEILTGAVVTPPPSSSGCNTDISEPERIDCYPGGGATEAGCVGIEDSERVNCIPEGGFSPSLCTERSCAFANTNSPNAPMCYFQVIKKSTGTVLLDTSLGGLTFSDQFLQIATRLPSTTLYGFGENEHQNLIIHNFDWESFGMWARDQPPDPGANLYGTHPFYISMEDDGNSHGVLFLNSNAQDVTTTPAPGLVYRTIGGVLDMYVFLGPEPNRVVEQYNTAIGTPFLPPYWSLGFQLCRYGYGDLNTVKETVARMDAYDIPLDVQYGDIDYMDEQRDFTYDTSNYAGLRDYVRELQAGGKHYVIILVQIHDIFLCTIKFKKNPKLIFHFNTIDISHRKQVWPPGKCAFPDYTNPDTETWWTDQCMDFHKTINFDGLWIDMNEPANFVTGSTEGCASNNLNNPPYMPKIWGNVLAEKTMCPDHRHKLGNHYDVHNLYGWSQSNVTIKSAVASTGKRPFVISRSTFVGSGQWAAHWLGDNNADWHDLRMSIIGMLEFNMFGIPYVGADICGFNGSPSEELCERWMELGAFYPFSRNHNGLGYKEQDPAAWGDEFAARSRAVLRTRYTLLPYLYELFYHAHTDGTGIVRPLSFEFANDKTTATIDEQFMWGAGLLLSPALYEGIKTVSAYFPDARWFNYYDGVEVGARGTTASVDAPLGTIPIHVRGGHIIPTQEPASNTEISRHNPFGLIIALDDTGSAAGDMYWDDGDTLNP
uniref:alpha-glucosidase n=1 Tax=Ciona savignyi TaxID=51511 RepID=H2YDF9_CIOSA